MKSQQNNNDQQLRTIAANTFRLGVLLLFFLSAIATVSALGIMPSGRVYEYEEGKVITLPLTIINPAQERDVTFTISAQGVLSEHIAFSQERVTLPAGSSEVNVTATIILPLIQDPGEHETYIIISEVASEEEEQTVSTVLSVTSRVRVRVPYPEQYVITALFVEEKDGEVRFVTSASNRGSKDVTEASTHITITGIDGAHVTTLQSNERGIGAGENVRLHATWNEPLPGSYVAQATTKYDGQEAYAQGGFTVGTNRVRVDALVFSLDQNTLRADVHLTNIWNSQVRDAYSELTITRDGFADIEITTFTMTIPTSESVILTGYSERAELVTGTYEATLTTHYEEGRTTTDVSLYFDGETLRVLEELPSETEEFAKDSWLRYTLLMILILLASIAYLLVRKNRKHKK